MNGKIRTVYEKSEHNKDLIKFAVVRDKPDGGKFVLQKDGSWKDAGLGLIDSNGGPLFRLNKCEINGFISSINSAVKEEGFLAL